MDIMTKLDVTPESKIQVKGLKVLKDNLGVLNTIKFLEQFDNGGEGDYTKEKYNEPDRDLTVDEILKSFK